MNIFRYSFAVSAATILIASQAPAVAAAPCTICGDVSIDEALLVRPMHWTKEGGWKFRSQMTSLASSFGDVGRYHQVSSFTHGNDNNALSLMVERVISNKRKTIELINLPTDRMRRSKMEIGYDVRTFGDDRLGLSMAGGVERRRLGFAALRGKWSNNRSLGVQASWTHAEHWRLSTGYTIDQSQNPRTGIRRSIQLAAGASPSAEVMRVGLDYSPSFALPDSFRLGIEARSDHMSAADATAMAMRDRDAHTLAMKLQMTF